MQGAGENAWLFFSSNRRSHWKFFKGDRCWQEKTKILIENCYFELYSYKWIPPSTRPIKRSLWLLFEFGQSYKKTTRFISLQNWSRSFRLKVPLPSAYRGRILSKKYSGLIIFLWMKRKIKSMRKALIWSTQFLKDITRLFLPMDRQEPVKRIRYSVVRIRKGEQMKLAISIGLYLIFLPKLKNKCIQGSLRCEWVSFNSIWTIFTIWLRTMGESWR